MDRWVDSQAGPNVCIFFLLILLAPCIILFGIFGFCPELATVTLVAAKADWVVAVKPHVKAIVLFFV